MLWLNEEVSAMRNWLSLPDRQDEVVGIVRNSELTLQRQALCRLKHGAQLALDVGALKTNTPLSEGVDNPSIPRKSAQNSLTTLPTQAHSGHQPLEGLVAQMGRR